MDLSFRATTVPHRLCRSFVTMMGMPPRMPYEQRAAHTHTHTTEQQAGKPVHLDTYEGPIQTRICKPRMVRAPLPSHQSHAQQRECVCM